MYQDSSSIRDVDVEPSGSAPNLKHQIELLDSIDDAAAFAHRCAALDALFPDSATLWDAKVRGFLRFRDFEKVVELVDSHDFGELFDPMNLVAKAEYLHAADQVERAETIYRDLINEFPDRREPRISWAKRLLGTGFLIRAHDLLEPVKEQLSSGSMQEKLWEKASTLVALLSRLEGSIPEDGDARILAMKHAILHFRNREVPPRRALGLGRLSLITGSLGPGGAERQLSRLAIELERKRLAEGRIGRDLLSRPVEIIVRSHGPERQNDFYLAETQEAGVELYQLNLATPKNFRALGVTDPDLLTLLDYLPPSVNYGVKRLTPRLQESETDIASIWQDGACLFAGLAALIAGVPQVQLAIRGLPPSLRRHMFRDEYEPMYKALAEVPGVTFLSNNRTAAQAYSDWLDIPVERFDIVYNGVQPMTPNGSEQCEAMWEEFAARTADATQTIGGVFRFDTDKQPNLFIRFAARYLKKHPDTRIVLVGGGRLLEGAIKLAEDLNIADRILFTDRSSRVGFWMTKMDVMLLLSRYEGLPNVLIEAQFMGVRVITTPAGGASECLIDGVTGHVLECCEKPDLDNIVAKTRDLAEQAGDVALLAPGGAGRDFLDQNFAIPTMLANFVRFASGLPAEETGDKVARKAA